MPFFFLIPTPAEFPTQGILTTFTGSNENPLSEGGAWANSTVRPTAVGITRPQRLSNEVATDGSNAAEAVWDTRFLEDQEAYEKISVPTDTVAGLAVWVRIQNEGTSSVVAYNFGYSPVVGGWHFNRLSNTTFTQIGGVTTDPVPVAGDWYGMSIYGSTLKGWYKQSGSVWQLIDTQTDSIISGEGKIGIYLPNTSTVRADDFSGGGEVSQSVVRKIQVVRSSMRW